MQRDAWAKTKNRPADVSLVCVGKETFRFREEHKTSRQGRPGQLRSTKTNRTALNT